MCNALVTCVSSKYIFPCCNINGRIINKELLHLEPLASSLSLSPYILVAQNVTDK